MSIQILSHEVINQIAAGEVVERPAHLVKELVENSLDAGSTQITVEVSSGGRFIRVIDNGVGIQKMDLALALQRHATSKIQQTNDLWNLTTFGFRGEALASAAAVSKLTLQSRSKKATDSYQIRSDFGAVSDVLAASKEQGTEIKIEDLFENVPARLKFLKSDSAENSQIKTVIKAMALVNPHVEFKMIESGKLELFFTVKKTHAERAKDVLGLQNLFEGQAVREKYKATSLFASPSDVAKTSRNIWIFAQGRWIQDRGLQAAVMEAYRSLLMHGEYPQCVVYLECDPSEIDVNIHPTKSQVKFQDASLAFRAVQAAVRDGLEKAPWVPRMGSAQSSSQSKGHFSGNHSGQYEARQPQNFAFKDRSFAQTQFQNKDFSFSTQALQQLKVQDTDVQNFPITPESINETQPAETVQGGFWSSLQVIGQINLTYIVCQKEDRMILVDQHAAHERVAFERLMTRWKGGQIDLQDYLFPLAIDLSAEKVEALLKMQDDIRRMGLEIEALGPNVLGVKSAPLFVKESSLPGIFEKMAQDLVDNGGSYNLEKSIADIFATMACHSVVRAGQSLSGAEMKELLQSMDQFPLSSFCPHGRPVSIELTFTELEKMFGRISS